MIALLLLTLGCSEYQLEEEAPPDPVGPVLTLDPERVDFGEVAVDAVATQEVAIRNDGDSTLRIEAWDLEVTSGLTVDGAAAPFDVAPGEEVLFDVSFTPAWPEESGNIILRSNDPLAEEALVPLSGIGLVGHLTITPSQYDFGGLPPSCPALARTFTLTNDGHATLEVQAILSTGTGFSLTDVPETPFELDPGSSVEAEVTFDTVEITEHEGRLWAQDQYGETSARYTGAGTEDREVIDVFQQPVGTADILDILLYVDRSCSMDDDVRNLSDGLSVFAETLSDLEHDWQLLVTTQDSGCVNTTLLDPASADLQAKLLDAAWYPGGWYTEAGLTIAREALKRTGTGQCNEGFLREDAAVSLVLVSDEPEQSAQTWSTMVTSILALAPDVRISAIAGDYPGGCTTADPGRGYYQATVATDGLFLSLCDAEWDLYMEELALAAAAPRKSFALSRQATAILEVSVDGVAQSTGWSYVSDWNHVTFSEGSIPEPGSEVQVRYAIEGCDG